LGTFMVLKGKDYYTMGAYPMVLAAGGVALERVLARRPASFLKPVLVVLLLGMTALVIPMYIPVLSVESFLRYAKSMPFKPQASEVAHRAAILPHHYAWQFGWDEMVQAGARVYNSIPADERAKTDILGSNFAESGAIEL